jgi:archaemetzincin
MSFKPGIIYIVPMGPFDLSDLGKIAENIEKQFEVEAIIFENQGLPHYALDAVRHQYNSNLILKNLLEVCPPRVLKVLGITVVDLFNPIFSFVFGEAQFGGKCAVISNFRLQTLSDGQVQPGCPSLVDRMEKEAVHELGHTFGIGHCSDPACVMSFSKKLERADAKLAVMCPACRNLLSWYMEHGPVPTLA